MEDIIDLETPDAYGRLLSIYNQLLYDAAGYGNTEMVKLMLDKGADDYFDALNWATRGGHKDIVKLLSDIIMREHGNRK